MDGDWLGPLRPLERGAYAWKRERGGAGECMHDMMEPAGELEFDSSAVCTSDWCAVRMLMLRLGAAAVRHRGFESPPRFDMLIRRCPRHGSILRRKSVAFLLCVRLSW